MGEAVTHLHARAAMIHGQIAEAISIQRKRGVDLSGLVRTYQSLLASLYEDDLPLASLADRSDVIFHAEGPSARHHAAASATVAWLCEEAERRLRQLSAAALNWTGFAGEAAQKDLAVLMNGVAPGSLYIGFSLDSEARLALGGVDDESIVPGGFEGILARARAAMVSLTTVPGFVGAESVSADIGEAIEDPQLRDATLMAAYHLSPTGKRGIHSLEISVPRSSKPAGIFTNRERVVLRETAVRHPILRREKSGTFVGELREIDLDARRFQLRNVPTLGTLRCVLAQLTPDVARRHIGNGVKVTGVYEEGPSGRPGLMRVEKIEPYQQQQKLPGLPNP
jgi:hypothetical protein